MLPESKEKDQNDHLVLLVLRPRLNGTICLRLKDQHNKPSTQEKMTLAEMGLGLKEISFNLEGDAIHIHSMLTQSYQLLTLCGGYTLM